MHEKLNILPAGNRQPVDPAITLELIDQLVEQFYQQVRMHPDLGPVLKSVYLEIGGHIWKR